MANTRCMPEDADSVDVLSVTDWGDYERRAAPGSLGAFLVSRMNR